MEEKKIRKAANEIKQRAKPSKSLASSAMAVIIALFLMVPLVIDDPYFLHIFILVFLFGFLGTAWSLLGMAGQLSLGHSAFLGIGGYTSTLLFTEMGLTPWVGMWIGAFACGGLGVIIGYPAFRLRGPYFALTTIALAEILRIYVENTEIGPFNIPLKAAMGLLIPLKGNSPSIFQFDSKVPFYYIGLGLLAISITVSYIINQSRLGYYLAAIRNDQDASEALGINSTKFKLTAMFVSCFLMAIGGTFYAQYFRYVNPERALGLSLSIEIALVGIVGGWQTVLGPAIGSILLCPLGELVRAYFGGSYGGLHTLIYGTVLMTVIYFMPNGINKWFAEMIKNKRITKAPSKEMEPKTQPEI